MPAKPLSWNEIRSRLDGFVLEFKDESNEHAEYATFWDQLLECFGISRRRVATFQHVAKRASTGNIGFIDFFWPKVVIGEHKSLGKAGPDGTIAEDQAFDYLAGGSIPAEDFPRYIISTDYAHMRVTDLETTGDDGTPHSVSFPITDLRHHAEELGFLGGYEAVSINTGEQEAASIAAAKVMADLYAALTHDADQDYIEDAPDKDAHEGEEIHATSILLTRLLFLMFGDDADLWERGLFTRFVEERTAEDGSDLGAQLSILFDVLDTPTNRRPRRLDETLQRFPHVNGGIFNRDDELGLLAFDRPMREALLRACYFEWSGISPAVFGSLFQAVKSKKLRRSAGEHYTTETNILKTVNPLFLDEYRARVRAAWHSAKKLRQILEELGTNLYCDPACGCGNFLVVAYRELRDIELQIITRLRELEGSTNILSLDVTLGLRVSLDQFHGFELGWWPAKIAETAMFLVDHQANLKMAHSLGMAPERLPITITAHVRHTNALTLDWQTALPPVSGRSFLFGNPPFLGDNTRDAEQKAELKAAWGDASVLSRLDYVTAWHAKTLHLFSDAARRGDWAYVTTNSITQGDQPPRLFGPIFAAGWRIHFAHRTFKWTSEAPNPAGVHCVIVGFTRDQSVKPRLFDYPDITSDPQEIAVIDQINAYLLDAPNGLVEKRSTTPLSLVLGVTEYGSKPTDDGNLIVEPEQYDEVMSDPVAAKYVHPYVGARELLHGERRWCLWLEGMDPADLTRSKILKGRVDAVAAFRAKSRAASTRNYPFAHLFRQLAKQDTGFVGIPIHVSGVRSYYPVAHFESDVIASNANFTIKDPDGFQFAIISSSMFITWQKTIGGRIKSDPRFASTLTWNTLPLPEVDPALRRKIIEAGKGVLAARDLHPERSLAQQYMSNAMDPELVRAHNVLDRLVDRAFGATRALTTEAERQKLLFSNYREMTSEGQLGIPAPSKRRRR